MTDADKKIKKYTASIAQKLNMPKDIKKRVMTDLVSSIHERREAGQDEAQIYAELGTPTTVAKELNEQMKDFTYRKSPWRWVCLVAAIVCCFMILIHSTTWLITSFLSSPAASIGIIGGADGPTAIFVAASPDYFTWHLILCAVTLAAAFIGFYFLSRIKQK